MKCSPLIGMLVQGFIELLKMIMIGMNPICVLKDFVKWKRFVYKLCSLWEWSKFQVPCQNRVFHSIRKLNINMCRVTFGVFFLSTMSNNKCWMVEKYFRIGALECIRYRITRSRNWYLTKFWWCSINNGGWGMLMKLKYVIIDFVGFGK